MNASELALLAIFILLIFFVVTRFREALQKWHDQEFLAVWLFALCFATGSLLELSKVHTWLDALIGLNNFSWFVGRLFFVFSAYFFARKCVPNYSTHYLNLSKWMKYGLLFTQFAITFFYWRGLGTASEHNYFSSLIAVDQTSLVIHALAFSFIFVMLFTLAHFYYRLFREETLSL